MNAALPCFRHGSNVAAHRPLPAHVACSHRLLQDLAGMRHGIVLPLARAATLLERHQAWFAFGYHNAEDFSRESLRRSARWLRDLQRLHAALHRFPRLELALRGDDGAPPLGQKAALCIARVATPETLASWIARARELPLPALKRTVAKCAMSRAVTRKTAPLVPQADSVVPSAGNIVSREASVPNEELASSEPHVPREPLVSCEAHVPIRLMGPPEMALAFDAVRALHAAVVGRDQSTEALVEAILGEAISAGCTPLDGLQSRLLQRFTRVSQATQPTTLENLDAPQQARRCLSLESPAIPGSMMTFSPATRQARRTLDEFRLLQERLGRLDAELQRIDDTRSRTSKLRWILTITKRLIHLQDRLEIDSSEILLEMHERMPWKLLGYAGLEAYAEEVLAMGRSTARRRVSMARQLRRHESTRRAYVGGTLGEEAARWVLRRLHLVPPASTGRLEPDFIAHAALVSVKRLRDEDAILHRDGLMRRVCLAQAITARRVPLEGDESSAALPDDAAWHASLERRPGHTRHRIVALELELLERLVRRGPLLEGPLTLWLRPDIAADFLACVETARQALAETSAPTAAEDSRLRPTARMARQLVDSGQTVPAWLGLLALLEECLWIWDEPRGMPRRPFDRIDRRDGFRCTAPGCTARARLETHHLVYRSHGGSDEDENLLVLCRFHHHQGEHGLLARARGRAPLHVTWRLGHEGLATWWRNETRLPPEQPELGAGKARASLT